MRPDGSEGSSTFWHAQRLKTGQNISHDEFFFLVIEMKICIAWSWMGVALCVCVSTSRMGFLIYWLLGAFYSCFSVDEVFGVLGNSHLTSHNFHVSCLRIRIII